MIILKNVPIVMSYLLGLELLGLCQDWRLLKGSRTQ
jgi:hypothetical protein